MKTTGYEIVRVINRHSLVDAESYQRDYRRTGGQPLEPGVYLVLRPTPDSPPRYGASVEFVGPFASSAQAHAAMEGPLSIESTRVDPRPSVSG